MKFFQDENLIYLWKPSGIPTTYGKDYSFIDLLESNDGYGLNVKESLLLNRLDNDTGGLLYFAKNEKVYNDYKLLQAQGKVLKVYIADVHGFIRSDSVIAYPIMHDRYNIEKMVVVKNPTQHNRGRGKKHFVSTDIQLLYYDAINNISTIRVYIRKGIRHQIRAHLNAIGHPIVGDRLYAKYTSGNQLHLWSIGLLI